MYESDQGLILHRIVFRWAGTISLQGGRAAYCDKLWVDQAQVKGELVGWKKKGSEHVEDFDEGFLRCWKAVRVWPLLLV